MLLIVYALYDSQPINEPDWCPNLNCLRTLEHELFLGFVAPITVVMDFSWALKLQKLTDLFDFYMP